MRATRAIRRDGWRISVGLLVFALLWLLLLDRGTLAPPTDNIEQLTWVRSLEWGYYKHPPLPTWLLWPVVRVMGWSPWATYVAGALCTLGAFALLWRFLRELRGRTYAVTALLAGLCVTFYNGRLYFYNHEIVLIPLVVGCAVGCWKAYTTRRIGWWIVLGICLGLGALAKYQIVVAGVAVLVFWLSQRGWRDPMQVFGLQVAGLTALAVFSPHLVWLVAHDFESLGYAMSSSLAASLTWPARVHEVARWWGDQMLNRAMPAWVLLAVLWLLARCRQSAPVHPGVPAGAPADPSRAFLLIFGFTPLVFVSVMTLATGSHIQLHWGTPYLLFVVPAVMELWRGCAGWRQIRPREAVVVFMLIQMLLMARVELTSPTGAGLARRAADWRYFDSQALAQILHDPAMRELGGPIRVISGPWAEAGALALRLPEQPFVLIDGQPWTSPWVPAGLARACGVLELSLNNRLEGFAPVGAAFPALYWRVLAPGGACQTGG
ncbi:glycosyltransferase family 39 protein [Achromobacter pestifer]|uniref:Lipopolysaccharide core galacturonosyltransferase RgtC n=1 Tax=Achromobacter pestifer TaxID=1353889 RepID=A0A6S6ZKG1_9BURK|nr:glycosyltransferase family 39 protein [Achromobacter pestifer]CAB3684626.1 Lipopolysaccharide core galacturonosyltransferase RgtC [Achromobacter pestifer]